MSEQNNDNIENFFRDHAQNHNIEFREADWKKLEARLDNELPVANGLWSFFKKFLALPLLLVLAPVLWFTVNHFTQDQQSQQIEEATSKNIVEDYPLQGRKLNTEQAVIPQTETQANTANKLANAGNIQEELQGEKNQINIIASDLNDVREINDAVGNEGQNTYKDDEKIGYAVSEDGADFTDNYVRSELHFLYSIPPSSKIESMPTDVSHVKTTSVIRPDRSSKVTFAVGLGYAPDFSTIGIGNFIAPGTRWAGTIEVGLSKRLLINTGIVWVNNKYEAYGEDYHAPSQYWSGGIVADQTYGECSMIDIPLNLRYNVAILNRHQLFISGGVSTYLLLKEDYYFHYPQYDPDLPYHWGTDKMTTYPFGIVNLSIGYQYALGGKGALQFEPFIKIPTTGVGWGNVDLYTIGAYFIYKYRIGK